MSQKLVNSLANGYEVKIGDYISRGYEIFKANMGSFIGYSVLYFVITSVINFIPFLNILGSLIVSPCLVFGFYLVANLISKGTDNPPFNAFFNSFNYIGKLIVITLITFVVVMICIMPFLISVGVSIFTLQDSSNSEILSAILAGPLPILGIGILVMIYVSVSWVFASMLAIFHNKESWASMEISRKVVAKNWFMIFLFLIVVGIIVGAGILFLGIGILFTLPLGMCSIYAAFEDICGLPDEDKTTDEIGQIGQDIQ